MFKVEKIDIVDHCPQRRRHRGRLGLRRQKRKKSPYSARVLMTRIGGDIYVRHVVREADQPDRAGDLMLKDTSTEDRNAVPSVLISIPQDPGRRARPPEVALCEI
jgi:hypothetical protein